MTRIAWICCILTMIVLPSPGIAKQPAQVQLTTIFTYTRDAAPGIREIGINFDGAESVLYSSQFGAEDMEITPDGQNLVGGFFNGEVILIPLDGSQPTVLYQVSNGFIQGIGTTNEDVNVAFTDGSDPVVINVKFNDPGNAVVVADASTGLTGHPQDTDVFVFNGMTYDATATETKVHIRVHGSTGPDAAQIDLSNGAVKAKVVDGNLWFTDNGRDWMGDDLPSDELNVTSKGGVHFGFPFCHQGFW